MVGRFRNKRALRARLPVAPAETSYHGDGAIWRAARRGVQPHHWRFGPMPEIDVTDHQLEGIVAFVRELQRENGIR